MPVSKASKEMDMHNAIKSTYLAGICIAIVATAFTDGALAGPISMAGSPVIKKTSALEQVDSRGTYPPYRSGPPAFGSSNPNSKSNSNSAPGSSPYSSPGSNPNSNRNAYPRPYTSPYNR